MQQFMMKSCEVAGVKIECGKLFQRIPTDSGMCCAFNAESALKASAYSDLVEEMRIKSSPDNEEKIIDNAKVGEKKGLQILVDQHSDHTSYGTVFSNFNGFKVFIGEPAEFPVPRERSIKIQPGLEHFIELSGYTVKTDSNVKSELPEKRKCYFKDESTLDFYSTYTFSSCKFECKLKHTSAVVGCTPWYLPHHNNTPACDPWKAAQFNTMMESDQENCTHCLADCDTTIHSVSQSSAPFR